METSLKLFVIASIIFSLPAVAAITYQADTDVDIRHSVRVDGAPVSDAMCNITIQDPNTLILSEFEPMTYDGSTETYNYTLASANTSELGQYCYDVTCSQASLDTTNSYCFEITQSGKEFTTGQSVTYVLMLLVVVGLFLGSFVAAFRIPFRNNRTSDDEFLSINWFKYLKIGSAGLAYLFGVWSIFLVWAISHNFLHFTGLSTMFRFLFTLSLGMALPVFVGLVIFSVINYRLDVKAQKLTDMGVSLAR